MTTAPSAGVCSAAIPRGGHSEMRAVFAVLSIVLMTPMARALDVGERVISPDRRFAVVATSSTEGELEWRSYVIRRRATGETLATCPKDCRFESGPSKILWSPDSRFVAISTRAQRHGDTPDLWEVTSRKAKRLNVDFSKEDYDIYVTSMRWLSSVALKCEVFGKTSREHRRLHPNEPWVSYNLVVRIDEASGSAKVLRSKANTPDQ